MEDVTRIIASDIRICNRHRGVKAIAKPTPSTEALLDRLDNLAVEYISSPIAFAKELNIFTASERVKIAGLLLGGHVRVFRQHIEQDQYQYIFSRVRVLPSRA